MHKGADGSFMHLSTVRSVRGISKLASTVWHEHAHPFPPLRTAVSQYAGSGLNEVFVEEKNAITNLITDSLR